MCIYLGDLDELHYDSPEHIIPAGLGGIKKLPSDFVSREFNNLSSKYERGLMRNSIISLPRQLHGPGKRGSLSSSKATRSSVHVFRHFDDGTFSLGYIKNGKPFEIPHIALNTQTGEVNFAMSKEASEAGLQFFKRKLTEFDTLKIKMINYPDLDSNLFLIGIDKDVENNFDCFIASADGKPHKFDAKIFTEIAKAFEDKSLISGSSFHKVESSQKAIINDDYYKSCGKIGFNCLAHLTGREFVMQDCFNPIRGWIVNGGTNNFVEILANYKNLVQDICPQHSHSIIITKIDDVLIADVCFYNYFHNLVRLAENFQEPFAINGMICDWKNKKEYDFLEYLVKQKIDNDFLV